MLFAFVLSTMFSITATMLLRQWVHGDLRRPVTAHQYTPERVSARASGETAAPEPLRLLSDRSGAQRRGIVPRGIVPRGIVPRRAPIHRAPIRGRVLGGANATGDGMPAERMRRCRPAYSLPRIAS